MNTDNQFFFLVYPILGAFFPSSLARSPQSLRGLCCAAGRPSISPGCAQIHAYFFCKRLLIIMNIVVTHYILYTVCSYTNIISCFFLFFICRIVVIKSSEEAHIGKTFIVYSSIASTHQVTLLWPWSMVTMLRIRNTQVYRVLYVML